MSWNCLWRSSCWTARNREAKLHSRGILPLLVVCTITVWPIVRVHACEWEVMRRLCEYVHTAVCQGECVYVAGTGHALLLAVVGAGGRGHGVARVDIVRVDRLPPRHTSGRNATFRERERESIKSKSWTIHSTWYNTINSCQSVLAPLNNRFSFTGDTCKYILQRLLHCIIIALKGKDVVSYSG